MPWEVKKSGSKYCVYKKGTSSPIKGGCHPTRKEAVNHMKALYTNVKSSSDVILSEIFASTVLAEEGDVSLVSIKDVPLISTGIEYPLSSGPTTFTQEDLEDAVKAIDDPHILPPRLKIGHTQAAAWIEAGGEPAIGKIPKLRLGDNNQTIYGDYEGVPEWLADILPVAYPNRSIEGSWNVKTVGGNQYRLVINAVSLLGVVMPGVTSLEDLKGMYGKEMPEGIEIAAGAEEGRYGVVAAVNVEDIRRQYYEYLDESGDSSASFWWVRAMELNPNALIVDDNNGKLFRVGFNLQGEKAKFQEPKEVKLEYKNVAASAAAALFVAGIAASAAAGNREVTTFASREESGRTNTATQRGGPTLDIKATAKRLGLPDGATEEQVKAELKKMGLAPIQAGVQPGESGQGGSGEPSMEDEHGHLGPTPEPSTDDPPTNIGGPATKPPADTRLPHEKADDEPEVEGGFVKLDVETFRNLRAGAAAGIEVKKEGDTNRRISIVAAAIKDGKIPPARKDHYIKLMNADEEGTTKLLGELQAGLVPVVEQGGSGGTDGNVEAEGLPDEWFPNIQRRRALAAQGQQRVSREIINGTEAQ